MKLKRLGTCVVAFMLMLSSLSVPVVFGTADEYVAGEDIPSAEAFMPTDAVDSTIAEADGAANVPSSTETNASTDAPSSTNTDGPSADPAPSDTDGPTADSTPSDTDGPSADPAPSDTDGPSADPAPTDTDEPTTDPALSDTDEPTTDPAPTDTDEPATDPAPTDTDEPTTDPGLSDPSGSVDDPAIGDLPDNAYTPDTPVLSINPMEKDTYTPNEELIWTFACEGAEGISYEIRDDQENVVASGAELASDTREIRFTPTEISTYTLTITAKVGDTTVSATSTIAVAGDEAKPDSAIPLTASWPGETLGVGDTVTLTAQAAAGTALRWEYQPDEDSEWMSAPNQDGSATYAFVVTQENCGWLWHAVYAENANETEVTEQ